jgi:hypothetical protein
MILIGWMMRAIILGAKFDECRACHEAGPHLLLRKTHWFTVFRIPVVLLWISHGVICTACGDLEGVGFLAMRRALKAERLPLGRSRPRFEELVRDHLGGSDPADWAAFGLEPGASPDEVRARWRQHARSLHPDAGGDVASFVQMQAVYQRLLSADQVSVSTMPDPAEVFDPIIKNPKRGFLDLYTKAWPVLVVAVLVIGAVQPPRGASATAPSTGSTGTSIGQPGVVGTAHTCWSDGTALNGCQDDGSAVMLFGQASGTRVTCWFVEPLAYGESASCTD